MKIMKKMQNKTNTIMIGGLKPLPIDERDFKVGSLVRLPRLEDIPDDFDVDIPIKIKNQFDSDYCSGYAITAVSESQEGVELNPEFQFFLTKTLIERDDSWGADLRNAGLSVINYGSLPQYKVKYDALSPREAILNPQNWTDEQMKFALQFSKESFAFVDGYPSHFDSIRATMWKYKEEKKTVFTGLAWCNEWSYSNGIIDQIQTEAFGHAIKIMGSKKINGKLYLKAQLSNGENFGDKGFFYFSKEVIDANAKYGALIFTDITKEKAKLLMEKGVKEEDMPFKYHFYILLARIKSFFK